MGDGEKRLNICHSYHTLQSPVKFGKSDAFSKSAFNFAVQLPDQFTTLGGTYSGLATGLSLMSTDEEYYKNYEHDEVPVKDSDNTIFKQYGRPLDKGSFTNADLENLERRIYKNVSQELQTEEGSLSSLESNIKFFKTTVERIFENFYSSMRDYELYKARFQEILLRSKEGSIDDMEDFIKDMFEHIMSSENSASKISRVSTEMVIADFNDVQTCVSSSGEFEINSDSATGLVEAYKNDHYLTDSTLEENCSKAKRLLKIEERFNDLLLSGSPCVEIELNGRNLVSEINVKQPSDTFKTESIASADNLKKLAAKKLELEKFIGEHYDTNMPDRDIPVKVSYAKKNIYLDEDFSRINNENNDASKSFLSKLCNILCRKFRKSSFI